MSDFDDFNAADDDPIFGDEVNSPQAIVQEPEDDHKKARPLMVRRIEQGDADNVGNIGQMVSLQGSGLAFTEGPEASDWTVAFEYPRLPPGHAAPKQIYVKPIRIWSDDPFISTTKDVFVETLVTWGNDGGRQSRVYNTTQWVRIPLSADRIEVSVRLRSRSLFGVAPIPVSPVVKCLVTAFFAPGIDGAYPIPTDWTDSRDLAIPFQINDRASRICKITGYLATPGDGAANVYVLLFDQLAAPVLNDPSVDGRYVQSGPRNYVFEYFNTRAFVNGLWIAVSSTGPLYTPVVGQTLVVNSEEAE